MNKLTRGELALVQSIGLVSALTIFLYIARSGLSGGFGVYSFVPLNLVLAWVPAVFAWLLVKEVKNRRWTSWQCVALSVLWLAFLPNAWYVLSDFIHIQQYGQPGRIYDILMFSALSLSGMTLGFASLYLVHRELLKRYGGIWVAFWVGLVILVCSFAVYLGRELRWNTWDIVRDPGGLVITVSDRVVAPLDYPGTLSITLLFFVFLSAVYTAIWVVVNSLRKARA